MGLPMSPVSHVTPLVMFSVPPVQWKRDGLPKKLNPAVLIDPAVEVDVAVNYLELGTDGERPLPVTFRTPAPLLPT